MSCSISSPTYTPNFHHFSDDDLDALELGATLFSGFDSIPPAEILCALLQLFRIFSGPWECMTDRTRRENVISAFGNPGDYGMTGDQVMEMVRTIQQCLTHDQIQSMLAFARYYFIVMSL